MILKIIFKIKLFDCLAQGGGWHKAGYGDQMSRHRAVGYVRHRITVYNAKRPPYNQMTIVIFSIIFVTDLTTGGGLAVFCHRQQSMAAKERRCKAHTEGG